MLNTFDWVVPELFISFIFMEEVDRVYPNDTTRKIRELIADLSSWKIDNEKVNQRITSMIISKLQEAELLSLIMVNHEEGYSDSTQQFIY